MMKPREIFEVLIKPFKCLSLRKDSHISREGELDKITRKDQKLFHFEALVAATRNFDSTNKLGEGGFGPVFKGKLEDGREIAVKKLSRTSNQGTKQFVNEAKLLTRVQHRNVVNLLGYCAHGDEKLLVYEYVANESLDKLLFDDKRRAALEWKKRYEIIVGVARGLLYLHEDAQNCIIHRDIKASNILLDDKWEPLIADFGMARLFSEDQTHVNTQVAGTRGYMAPEYFLQRQLSVKVDVFSFGVLVLELISGKKNSTFEQPDALCLLEWAWELYKKGCSLDIMDKNLTLTAGTQQVAMCIQIGLLCTQADPKRRPAMQRVVLMLLKKPGIVEEPTRPGYYGYVHRRAHRPKTSSSTGSSSNESTSCTALTSSFAYASPSNTDTTTTTSPRLNSHRRHL